MPSIRQFLTKLNTTLNSLESYLRSPLWIMVGVLLLAAMLRLHDLTLQSLWFDELMTWQRSNVATPMQVIAGAAVDVWPPGYSLFMYVVMKLIGASEFILRFPPAMGGVLSAAAIYTLGRRLAGHWAGVASALILTVLQASIYYGQEARPYSGVILYTILSSYFWLRLMQSFSRNQPIRRLDAAAYIVCAFLLLYWNYMGAVMVGLQALAAGGSSLNYRMLPHPRRWPPILLIYAIIGIGYAPWLGEMLHDFQQGLNFPARMGTYGEELMAYFRFLLNLEQKFAVGAIWLVGIAVALEVWRRFSKQGRSLLLIWLVLIGWLVLPFSLIYLRSVMGPSSLIVHRYLLISLPAACLLIGIALTRLPIPRWCLPALLGVMIAGLLYNLVYQHNYYAYISKVQFRQVSAYVAEHNPADSIIVGFTGYPGTDTNFNYYFEQFGLAQRVEVQASYPSDVERLERGAESDRPYVWLVTAMNPPGSELMGYLTSHYDLVDHQTYLKTEVWLFKKHTR